MHNELYLVNQGKFPLSLIPPKQLLVVLQTFLNNIPKINGLPYPINQNNKWYYSKLSTMLIPDGRKFHVVTIVPLVLEQGCFLLFLILSVPVHHQNYKLMAKYSLHAAYIAVSTDKQCLLDCARL